ncbi:MAG: hypothetical protein KatS3mg120_0936 [Erythrobacter sp.]|nr:MAG: hypothetical protein KatS3mg120_0936 [Erythrobacter sp.]
MRSGSPAAIIATAPGRTSSRAPPSEPRIEVRQVPDMAPGEAGGATLDVGAIPIEGLEALPATAFADVIEPFAGRPRTRAALARLAMPSPRLRAHGHVLATVWISEQRLVAGTLRVRIDDGANRGAANQGG